MYQKAQSYEVQFLRCIHRKMDIILCHFWPFLTFYPPNIPKNQNFEKMKKKVWRCHHFTHVYQKSQSCDACFLRHHFIILGHFLHFNPTNNQKNQNILSIFFFFSPPPPPNSLKNQNFEKIKKPGDIIILHIMCTKNYDHMMYCFWDLVCDRRTKRQTDKRMKKWHTEVGAPPKNLNLKDCIRPMLH